MRGEGWGEGEQHTGGENAKACLDIGRGRVEARPTDYLASMLLDIGLRGKRVDQVLVIDPSEKVPEGISRNIKEFTYLQKGFRQWIEEGGLKILN